MSLLRRVPFIAQMERSECGAACLAMVLARFGRHVALAELRDACAAGRDGVSARALADAALAQGLTVRPLRVAAAGLGSVPTPAVLFWEANHFVVLESFRDGNATIVDPRAGRQRVAGTALAAAFSGVALAFAPGPRFARRARHPGSQRLAAVIRGQRGPFTFVLVAALLLELLSPLMPAATQVLVDHVILPGLSRWVVAVGAALLAGTLCRIGLTLLRDRIVHALNVAVDIALMSRFVTHLLRLPVSFFDQRAVGDLMGRVQAATQLRELASRALMALLDALLAIGYAALMLVYSLRLGAMIIALSLARLALGAALRRGTAAAAAAELAMVGREMGAVVEAVSTPEVVKAFGIEDALAARYSDRLIERLNASIERARLSQRMAALMALFDAPAQALVIWVGGCAVVDGAMTLGVFSGFLTLAGLLRRPLESLVGFWDQVNLAQGTWARVEDVMASAPEPRGDESPGPLDGELEMDAVSFAYSPRGPRVLDQVSLHVAPGQTLAIVGPSGAGKSTLLRLMLGLLRPTEGSVRLDGLDLRRLDLDQVRAQIGVVMQEPFLFDDTLRANLSLREQEAPRAELLAACRQACLDDLVAGLPRGLDTMVGGNGAALSGGQRQRLSLARALVSRPRILFLDEATSSLDGATEAELGRRLSGVRCTRVVIAHRLATVRDADQILVLDGGRVVQRGDYATLSGGPGLFRDMLRGLEDA